MPALNVSCCCLLWLIVDWSGRKEVFIYPPSDFRGMYPFPINHACDRQSMVNVDDPDFEVRVE